MLALKLDVSGKSSDNMISKYHNDLEGRVWYFAYGSNMSREKFSGSRGIVPLASARVLVPGWALSMEVPGMPYSEPAMSSIAPSDSSLCSKAGEADTVETREKLQQPSTVTSAAQAVHGVAYLVTKMQYTAIIASEGGGIAYDDIKLTAEALGSEDENKIGSSKVIVRTLVNVSAMSRRDPEPRPSARYKQLLLTGASEASLPKEYIDYLEAWPAYVPNRRPGSARCNDPFLDVEKSDQLGERCGEEEYEQDMRRWIGSLIFISAWGPLLAAMEKLCYATIRESDGNCPVWVKLVVRWAVWAIWWSHDVGFSKLFGRGDGRGATAGTAGLSKIENQQSMNPKVAFRPWYDTSVAEQFRSATSELLKRNVNSLPE